MPDRPSARSAVGALDHHTFESGDEELSLDFYSEPARVAVEGPAGK